MRSGRLSASAWAVRAAALALAVPAGFSSGCGGNGGAGDAGERPDIVFGDVVQYDRPRPLDTGAGDAGDVATLVDVRPLEGGADAGPGSDAAADAAMDAVADAALAQCSMVANEYGRLVVQAEACGAGSDCAAVVCETPCCYCQVYVNPNSAAYPSLARLASQWQALHCADTGLCPTATACDPPASAACTSRNRCATVRAPAG